MTSDSDLLHIHVNLVMQIEKYPLLYNYKLAEYSRKDLTEKAWSEVSNKTRISVSECKEKWRNIRSTFLRSLKSKPSGSKPKKPYYLKDHLTFLLPYVKLLNEHLNKGNIPATQEHSMDIIDVDVEASEEQILSAVSDDSQDVHQHPTSSPPVHSTPAPTGTSTQSTLHGVRRRKRTNNDIDAAMIQFLKKKTEKREEVKETHESHPMNHFFLSLLPEFSEMTEHQIRTFKIKVLQIIDEIKQPTSPADSTGESYFVYSPISSVETIAPQYKSGSLNVVNQNFCDQAESREVNLQVHTPYDEDECPGTFI